jgi:peptide/nickel transport system substrate-binding protein
VKNQWTQGQGRLLTASQNWTPISVQFINSNPPIITDLQFRQAMIYALDRQQLVDTIFAGQSTVADSYVPNTVPGYHEQIEPSVVKYAYDPRQAAQLMEGLGFTRRPDGFLYFPNGQKLTVSVYTTTQNDIHPKSTAAVADYWKQLGVEVEQNLIPPQRAQDREYRATFPAFELVETADSVSPRDILRLSSRQVPLPENNFQQTGNNSRYRNADLDDLLSRYTTTIPMTERMQALAGVARHLSMNLPQLPLFHGVDPTLVSSRIVNVTARGERWTQAWNVQDWDVSG